MREGKTLAQIQADIARLPASLVPEEDTAKPPAAELSPLAVISKQGRLILRLSAASESLEARLRDLSQQTDAHRTEAETLREERRQAEVRVRQMANEAIRLLDSLEWAQTALTERGNAAMAANLAAAHRTGMQRLAALGIREISVYGPVDGRLHETVDTVPAPPDTPRYHIVSVVRAGWQYGADVLRRAEVVTAE